MGFGAHPSDDARLQTGPVVGRTPDSPLAQGVSDFPQLAQLARTGRATLHVTLDGNEVWYRQLAIMERRKPLVDRLAGE
jgi:hypothetical protein